jgi:probable rRNA maturation factor
MKKNLVEINNTTRAKIDEKLVKKTVEKFLHLFKINKSVSVAFVGDKAIQRLNKQYRGIDRVTDVLAFEGEDDFLGEIIIDYAQIKRQAKQFSKSAKEELVFILVHGLLHLVGFRDDTKEEKEEMIKKGEEIVKILGVL